jgi:hypothetical protein
MSYPVLNPKVRWSLVQGGFHKTPSFNNATNKTATGRRSTSVFKPYATWDFEVDLNHVEGGEAVRYSVLQSFLGTYLACCGSGNFFLFTDPNDNFVADQSFLLNVTPGGDPTSTKGDGTSVSFQLGRYIDVGMDILQNVSTVSVFVNGAAAAATIGPTGVIDFATAPANNAVLTWKGRFQYLCQFSDDTLKDLARVSKNNRGFLWSCSSITFEGVFV